MDTSEHREIAGGRYVSHGYNNKPRWMSYFYQIKLLRATGCKTVLEVGSGNGWIIKPLKDVGIDVKTLDICEDFQPDYLASVEAIPLPDNSFDVTAAFEILEHLPFEKLASNLKEMGRVSRGPVIISLPDQRRTLLNLQLKIPLVKTIEILIRVPRFTSVPDSKNGHYFEIGLFGFPLRRVKEEIAKSGLTLVQSFTTCDGPTTHYFVLNK